jgi:hypothetical protein
MKQKKKVPKPRNEFVTQLISRAGAGGGAHGKSKKAKRRSDKVQLQKETFDKTQVFSKVFC